MSELKPEDNLLSVTAELGVQYKAWKAGETAKNKQRDKFFQLLNAHFESETLAEQILPVRAATEEEALELVAKSHPKWTVDDIREAPDCEGLWEIIIIENPEFKPHSFVNPDDGQVYTRQIQSGSIMLDDERLQEKDPELWREVTTVPNCEFIKPLIPVTLDLDAVWDGPRNLIPFEDLSPDTLARLGEYIYEGKPSVKLAAPRKAKEEDLASSSEV